MAPKYYSKYLSEDIEFYSFNYNDYIYIYIYIQISEIYTYSYIFPIKKIPLYLSIESFTGKCRPIPIFSMKIKSISVGQFSVPTNKVLHLL
jgi:hypothetical protein